MEAKFAETGSVAPSVASSFHRPINEDLAKRPTNFGNVGRQIDLVVNSFPMRMLVDMVCLYDVQFDPDIPADASMKRRKIVKKLAGQIERTYGSWFYDNTRIWAIRKVDGIKSFPTNEGHNEYTLSVRYLKEVDLVTGTPEQLEMIVHIILSKCIRSSKLLRVGRNYFESNETIESSVNTVRSPPFPDICLWKGYSIAVEPTMSGLQLKADVSHRILQQQNVRELIDGIQDNVKHRHPDWNKTQLANEVNKQTMEELKGSAVLTFYNKRVWRIHDIDWSIGIDDEFMTDEGESFSYKTYFYKRYGAVVSSPKKGMLIHEPRRKPHEPHGGVQKVILVPELCYITGLNKKMKANYKFMRNVADKTRLGAARRHNEGRVLVTRLKKTIERENELGVYGANLPEDTRERKVERKRRDMEDGKISGVDLSDVHPSQLSMPVTIDPRDIHLKGRVLKPCIVELMDNRTGKKEKVKSFNELMKKWGNASFFPPKSGSKKTTIKRWAIVFEPRQERDARDLLEQMKRLSKQQSLWGTLLNDKPEMVKVDNRKRQKASVAWEHCLDDVIKEIRPHMLVCVVPSGNTNIDIYSAVKTTCCSRNAVLSQCIQEKSFKNQNRLTAIVRNLLKQMLTKAGSIPWRVKWNIPDNTLKLDKRPTMVVGIDVNHDFKRQQSSVGFVASYDQEFLQYNSQVSFQKRGMEIVGKIKSLMTDALKRFKKEWKRYPSQIVVFRDGVSNSQLNAVQKQEIAKIHKAFEELFKDAKKPKLAFIVVQKRVTARFLTRDEHSVPPGTVVDNEVVSSRFWDYYLVTCEAPRAGTATPSRYIVVCDEIGMSQNDIQSFTHQMCSLYFNWPGPVRTPAPCMYASKIGYLFGTAMVDELPKNTPLSGKPYYL